MILTAWMAHPRTELRQAVIALLVNANTAAGARVEDTRVDPIGNAKLPLITVYTLSEPVDVAASAQAAPRELKRDVQIEIAGFVAHSDAVPVATAMDNLAAQIEAAMDADPYLSGKAGDSMLEDTELEVRAENGRSDPLIGIVTLTYSATYRTQPGAVTATDDLLRVKATHKIVDAVDENAANDEFVVQETTP